MKQTIDEKGVTWTVMAGDPANQSVNKLKRLGLTYIVLPRRLYLHGTIPETIPECSDYIRSVRMSDCLYLLKGDDK